MNLAKTFNERVMFIKGTRKIGLKNQYLISTGLPALDAIFGGGCPLGSILLIEEDECGTFAKIMLKVFLSEGIVSEHALFIASQEIDTRCLTQQLPSEHNEKQITDSTNENLNIAWRYQDMPKCNSAPSNINPFGNTYDITRYMEINKVNNTRIYYYDSQKDHYHNLLKTIYNILSERTTEDGGIVRIGLHSLGSILWNGNLILFLHQLRALIRNAFAACIITIHTNLLKDEYITNRCEHMCDAVLKLESLENNENPAYSDYNGLIHLHKLPAVNRLDSYKPETSNWGFKLKNKQFLIEKIHISPDLEENFNREGEDLSKEYLPG